MKTTSFISILNRNSLKSFFDQKGEASFLLFSKTEVVYHNPQRLDCFAGVKLVYTIEGKRYDRVEGPLALAIRDGKIIRIDVEVQR
jgi:hypothetical protein